MAIGILGTIHQAHFSTNTSGTALSGTYAVPAGSRRSLLVFVGRGYVGGDSDTFPTTITYGGQTLSRVVRNFVYTATNGEGALYYANESTISSMSDGDYSISFNSTLGGGRTLGIIVIAVGDTDQTAGIVASDSDGLNGSGTLPQSLTLSVASGDWGFGFGFTRGDDGPLSIETGMTLVVDHPSSGDTLSEVEMRVDRKTASGSTVDVEMNANNFAAMGFLGAALREDTGGGGGGNLPLLHALGEAA